MSTFNTSIGGVSGNENYGTLYGTLVTNGVQLTGRTYLPSSISGTSDYERLYNKPSIESVELIGNKTFEQLGLEPIDIDDLLEILT